MSCIESWSFQSIVFKCSFYGFPFYFAFSFFLICTSTHRLLKVVTSLRKKISCFPSHQFTFHHLPLPPHLPLPYPAWLCRPSFLLLGEVSLLFHVFPFFTDQKRSKKHLLTTESCCWTLKQYLWPVVLARPLF